MEGRKATIESLLLFLLLLLLSHALCEPDAQTAPMEKAEQEALYSTVQGFVGRSWNGSGLYPDPCGWTPIQGVACDLFNGSWYVTSLSIGPVLDNSLRCTRGATFSNQLFELRHLKTIGFFNCFSSPTVLPSQNWDHLEALETLEFRSNRGLAGPIPPAIGQLVSLESLVMVDNSLSGQMPEELGRLARLKRLALSGNRLSGPIPASLGMNMADLLILDLSRNSLTGPLHASLGGLTSLLKLDVSDNLLNGALPGELGGLRSLTLLDVRDNGLSGALASSLEGMASLQDMLLRNNPMGGELGGFRWGKLASLANLDLSNTSLAGEIPQSIGELTRLRFLALDNNHLSGAVPPGLGALPSLNALYLNGNDFSGEVLFTGEFYRRLGRRFAAWGNPRLCCRSEIGPLGVGKCSADGGGGFDSNNKVSREIADTSSSPSSSWISGSCVFCVVVMQMLL